MVFNYLKISNQIPTAVWVKGQINLVTKRSNATYIAFIIVWGFEIQLFKSIGNNSIFLYYIIVVTYLFSKFTM